MKVTASEIEGSQVILEMEIESERVDKAMDRAYRRLASRVNVPGFRRGKAPRVMVERVVGKETLMSEALELLVPEAYQEAVQETGIDPVDTPKLDVVSAEPLSVRATVAVRPKVELGDYRAIRQTVETPEVTEEQVESTLENLRESRAQWVPVERESKAGDMLTLDLVARTEDRTFVDNKGLHLIVEPGRPILAPGVAEQLIGMKATDHKAFDITLPEDFSEKELAGQQATVEVAVSEVKEKAVPAFDDELARSLGEFQNLEELRKGVREELEAQAKAQARRNLEESVLAAVIDQAKAEPPTPWVEEQAEALTSNTRNSLGREGLTFEQFLRFSGHTEENYKEEMLSTSRRQLKRSLVLDAVADAEGITVSEDEIESALQEARASRGGRSEAAEGDSRLRANLASLLRERKAVARLVEIATGGAEAEEAAAPEKSSSPEEQSQTEENG